MRVGWLGLGAMGAPMAACLVAAGHSVSAYDVVPDRLLRALRRPLPCPRL
jgi:3-hydroxyisobutyrate dehydrogenase-like beta-hydroxyacid dehydrogenase